MPRPLYSVVTKLAILITFSLPAFAAATRSKSSVLSAQDETVDWQTYGGQLGQHFSPLKQIATTNVKQLKQVWSFDTGESTGLETTPIVVGDAIYTCTPSQKIIKLNAATGEKIWTFDSSIASSQPSRGVAYWSDGNEGRILASVMNYLYALDPKTGKPIPSFGENGRIDLRKDLRGSYRLHSVALTTPGTIYKDLIIVGGRVPEDYPAPPGDIRAYDVRTGKLRWAFHTIPHPDEPGYETWPKDAYKYAGSANNWCGMTLDPKTGILYVPTGSAVFDFYGGDRVGDDLYANTLLALDASTGKMLWHFQGVHHDIWDRDFPSPPTLVTVKHDGKLVDAVAQTTKQGYIYVQDRATGKPLFPVEEVKVPPSTVPGESASPTQPRPVLPAPFARQGITASELTNRTPEAHAWAVKEFATLDNGGPFTPFRLDKLELLMPGFDGGAEWGGSGYDPTTHTLFVNSNDIAWIAGLTLPPSATSPGEALYRNRCSMCHGIDRAGQPPAFPSLLGIATRLPTDQIAATIHNGKGRMPGFSDLSDKNIADLNRFFSGDAIKPDPSTATREMTATPDAEAASTAPKNPYKFTGYKKFLDPDGYPAVAPPWGMLSAINLDTGKYLWRVPFGEYPELAAKGMKATGSENYGGPIVTAGGLLFISATVHDDKIRAYDVRTGKILWEAKLPFAGLATPTTYMVRGKQYLVIAASGGKNTAKHVGGVYVAFALP
jgi:quinoprotein glucose dehydrogenase